MEPDIAMFDRLYELCGGAIKLVDMAPEVTGAVPFISAPAKSAWCPLRTPGQLRRGQGGLCRGRTHVTHLFNAMPPFNHRDPGVVGAASDTRPMWR